MREETRDGGLIDTKQHTHLKRCTSGAQSPLLDNGPAPKMPATLLDILSIGPTLRLPQNVRRKLKDRKREPQHMQLAWEPSAAPWVSGTAADAPDGR